MRTPAAALLMVVALVPAAAAQSLPALTKPVNDFAALIDDASSREIDRRIRALESRTRDAVVVVTVETIEPFGSIEDYAVKLFEQAGIGQRDKDNGLLIVVAKNERQVRIEVGYDLEEFVPDGYAGDVIRQQFLPAFRQGDYGAGLLAGTTRIINRIAERRGVTLDDVPAQRVANDQDRGAGLLGLLPVAILILFILIAIARAKQGPRSRYRGPRSPWGGFGGPFGGLGGGFGGFGSRGGGFGGFGGGGFGGFGGGMSGGGGASGRW